VHYAAFLARSFGLSGAHIPHFFLGVGLPFLMLLFITRLWYVIIGKPSLLNQKQAAFCGAFLDIQTGD
jgi:hypothetical protein